ncbi:unnamed protein product [Didymodactylos carnosus]|uniref:DUF5077 domain-containing protein n=1 Tax=Didymodactylos carnosus TaxID=1234261 RepID=A0A814Y6F8_9BILA|nr:unnamed protein product [Didymodactylos carnosus]CAF1322129.1 unnamed protein product [Didymodactylos carnosus]CAF3988961.1 unnamed protein product [Didymodactylos carnosus]CAF4132421.1 unnamed protein product [Didymodactylos carnosus]
MTNGFKDGYFGIQINSPTERRILFSIWSNYETDDPREVPTEDRITLLQKGQGVTAQSFGCEGCGGQSFINLKWKTETVYKLLIHAEASGTDSTIFIGYYLTPENNEWQMVAKWHKPKTCAKLLSGLYSFVENFAENGNDAFGALYGNQWVKTTDEEWICMNKAKVSTTANEHKHQRYDWGAGVKNKWFYMFSGGFTRTNVSKYGDDITRPLDITPPDIRNLPK